MQDSIYREEILEHFHEPQNFGVLENCDISAHQTNPFCGDDIEIFVTFSDSGQALQEYLPLRVGARMTEKIETITFTGKGCAISIASASMLTEYVKGKDRNELTKFSQDDMLDLLNIDVSETRKKCALLAFSVLKDCLV